MLEEEVTYSSQPSGSRENVNWNLCLFCQTKSTKPLQCPAKTKRKDIGAGYKYVAEHLIKFKELNALPFDICVPELETGHGLEATLNENNASWHKKCRDKISNLKLERAQKRKDDESVIPSPVKTRRSMDISTCSMTDDTEEDVCIFCNTAAGSMGLHKASTLDLDFRVRKCTADFRDSALISKLAAGDMVAIDAKYHNKCLSKLYKKAEKLENEACDRQADSLLHGIAFAELVSYIEIFDNLESKPVFKMSDFKAMYSSRIHELGGEARHVHTTRLKNRILAAIPTLRAHNEGREVLLAFDQTIGNILKNSREQDYDSDALILAKASKIVRKDIFNTKQSFAGHFPQGCNDLSVPDSLRALVTMILDGPDMKNHLYAADQPASSAAQTISQLLSFNCVKHNCSDSFSKAQQR